MKAIGIDNSVMLNCLTGVFTSSLLPEEVHQLRVPGHAAMKQGVVAAQAYVVKSAPNYTWLITVPT